MGEGRPGVALHVDLHPLPGPLIVSDALAGRADGDEAAEFGHGAAGLHQTGEEASHPMERQAQRSANPVQMSTPTARVMPSCVASHSAVGPGGGARLQVPAMARRVKVTERT